MSCHLRSISFPSRPHALVLKVEEVLHKLRTFVTSSPTTAPMLCTGLRGLGDLYEVIEELLHLPSSEEALSRSKQRKWVEAELDSSIGLLDLCSTTRDNLVVMKEHIQDLQLAFRRGADATVQSKVQAYVYSLKKSINDLRNGSNQGSACSVPKQDSEMPLIIRILVEAREITLSILQYILSFLSRQMPKPKSSKWSLLSRTLRKKRVTSEEELEDNDVLVFASYSSKDLDAEGVLRAQTQLHALEVCIDGLEHGLECSFRHLIQTRVSLLNILSS